MKLFRVVLEGFPSPGAFRNVRDNGYHHRLGHYYIYYYYFYKIIIIIIKRSVLSCILDTIRHTRQLDAIYSAPLKISNREVCFLWFRRGFFGVTFPKIDPRTIPTRRIVY